MERLSSSTQSEEWAEIVEQVDISDTFTTESFKLKARRKFAVANGKNFEEVTLAEVEQSPQGLRGWGEMALSVPGIEDCPSESAVSTPRSGNGKRKAEAEAKDDTAEGARSAAWQQPSSCRHYLPQSPAPEHRYCKHGHPPGQNPETECCKAKLSSLEHCLERARFRFGRSELMYPPERCAGVVLPGG